MNRHFTDHLDRQITLEGFPSRVISLCPSQTETIIELNKADCLVGRTAYCIHPEKVVASIPTVGGTKKVNFKKIKSLDPELIICEKEENTPEMVRELEKIAPVFVTDVRDIESAYRMIYDLGKLTGSFDAPHLLVKTIRLGIEKVEKMKSLNTLYFIWKDPWMVAGKDTFIDAMLEMWGLRNLGRELEGRYPELSENALIDIKPELILLSSEPYSFSEAHIQDFSKRFPDAKVELVDGEMFSWYGSRMLKISAYLNSLKTSILGD